VLIYENFRAGSIHRSRGWYIEKAFPSGMLLDIDADGVRVADGGQTEKDLGRVG
jgi:hypothetical protein